MNHLLQPDLGFFVSSLSIQRSFDDFGFPFRPTPNNRQILLFQPALLHEQSKSSGGCRCFRDENETTRFAVEPVYDRNLAAIGNFKGEQFAQLLPERIYPTWFRGMNEEEWRFIHNDVIVRLIDDLEMESWSDGVMNW